MEMDNNFQFRCFIKRTFLIKMEMALFHLLEVMEDSHQLNLLEIFKDLVQTYVSNQLFRDKEKMLKEILSTMNNMKKAKML